MYDLLSNSADLHDLPRWPVYRRADLPWCAVCSAFVLGTDGPCTGPAHDRARQDLHDRAAASNGNRVPTIRETFADAMAEAQPSIGDMGTRGTIGTGRVVCSAEQLVNLPGRIEHVRGIGTDTAPDAMAQRYHAERGADPYPWGALARLRTDKARPALDAVRCSVRLASGVAGPVLPVESLPVETFETLRAAVRDAVTRADAATERADSKRERAAVESLPSGTLGDWQAEPVRLAAPVSGPGTVRALRDAVKRDAEREAHAVTRTRGRGKARHTVRTFPVWSLAERETRRARATVRAGRVLGTVETVPQWASERVGMPRLGGRPTGAALNGPVVVTRADGTTERVNATTGKARKRRLSEREQGLAQRAAAIGHDLHTADAERSLRDLSGTRGKSGTRARTAILDAAEARLILAERAAAR